MLIDPPRWPAHGRTWSHLVSDDSLGELHSFARRLGVPPRAFSGDHYDVPADRYDEAVRAGAQAVEGKVLLARLVASGLRVPKRRGERFVDSRRVHDWLPESGPAVLDLIASRLPVPAPATVRRLLVTVDARRRLLVVPDGPGLRLPDAVTGATGASTHRLRPTGFHRLRLGGEPPAAYVGPRPWAYVAYLSPGAGTLRPGAVGGSWVEAADPQVRRLEAWPLVELVLDGAWGE